MSVQKAMDTLRFSKNTHIDLHELIRKIRACKSAAEERKEISQEMANIRSAFKEKKSAQYRLENVAKLMYLDMLGYQTYFGQMEVLKLLAMPGFPEKRVGYLGLMQLLDENTEILQLVPSTIKNDLENSCPQIVSLALTALGHICSKAMSYDFATDIEKLLKRSPPQIRKKACLCAARIVAKTEETFEYLSPAMSILTEREKYHGLRISAIVLILTIIRVSKKAKRKVRRQISSFVRLLRELVLSSYDPDYDTNGVTDPFLQVKLIQLMRELAVGDSKTGSAIADVLAQVATNTESNKNPGNAILYECVTTILSIEAESSLRVLAINILGRFLVNRDNNIRYVALNTLQTAVKQNAEAEQAIQRHRSTIVECIKDGDITIRRRALSLVDSLVNRKNVEKLVGELISFVPMAQSEFKKELCEKICYVVHRYSVNEEWHIDTMCEILEISEGLAPDFAADALIGTVAKSGSLRGYATHKLFRLLADDPDEVALRIPALWCLGEYGDLLGRPEDDYTAVSPKEIVETLKANLNSIRFGPKVKHYALTSCLKLTNRIPATRDILDQLISKYSGSQDLELQSRAIEYQSLLEQTSVVQKKILEVLPEPPDLVIVVDKDSKRSSANTEEEEDDDDDYDESEEEGESEGSSDEESDSDEPPVRKKSSKRRAVSKPQPAAPAPDLLGDIFGAPSQPQQSQQSQSVSSPGDDLLAGLFGPAAGSKSTVNSNPNSLFPSQQQQPSSPSVGNEVVFNEQGVSITFKTKAGSSPNITLVNAEFRNSNSHDINNFNFSVAVPKYMKLQLKAAQSNVLPANNGGVVTQAFRLWNSEPQTKQNVVKVKVDFQDFSKVITTKVQRPGALAESLI